MKNVEYYLKLPYTVILRQDEDADFVARVDELPGCAAHGKTEREALDNLREVKQLWITDCLEQGDPVPEPSVEESLPSGKWVQRVPRTLHKKLVALAKKEKVSLNQLVTGILAEAVGVRSTMQVVSRPHHMGRDQFAAVCESWAIEGHNVGHVSEEPGVSWKLYDATPGHAYWFTTLRGVRRGMPNRTTRVWKDQKYGEKEKSTHRTKDE